MSTEAEKIELGQKNDTPAAVTSIQQDDQASIDQGTFRKHRLLRLLFGSAEARGVVPVPIEERTQTSALSLFALWFTADFSLLPIATGMSGTLVFGLSLTAASSIILISSFIFVTPIAWMSLMGPKMGLRQMIQSRYYFGYYSVLVIVILQLALLAGYTITTTIVSAQTLAALSEGSLNLTGGITITIAAALVVSFLGYSVLPLFETYSWIPTLIALLVTLGVVRKYLYNQSTVAAPTVRAVISFGSLVGSLILSWVAVVSDFSVYVSPEVSRKSLIACVYTDYSVPSIPLLILGAAIGGAIPNVPAWTVANNAYSVGGVMYTMSAPIGNFSKFVAVLLTFSVVGNAAVSLYALSISLQTLHPWLVKVPRPVFSITIAVIVAPVAVVTAHNFYNSLGNFLGLIGDWTAAYTGVALTNNFYFRGGDYRSYRHEDWNNSSKLPWGVAALGASALSFALIVPAMDTAWFVGPIAAHTGDLGIESDLCISPILYIVLRKLEIRYTAR